MKRPIALDAYGQSISGIKIVVGTTVDWNFACKDPNDPSQPLDLTGLAVISSLCSLDVRRNPEYPPKISREGTITDAVNGLVKVPWASGDTVQGDPPAPLESGRYLMDLWIDAGIDGRAPSLISIYVELIPAATLPGTLVTPLPGEPPLGEGTNGTNGTDGAPGVPFGFGTDTSRPATPVGSFLNTSEGGALFNWNGSEWVMADGFPSHFDECMADSPWAYYQGLETTGNVLADSSGNGRPGSCPGLTPIINSGLSIVRRSPKPSLKNLDGVVAPNASFPFGMSWTVEWEVQFGSDFVGQFLAVLAVDSSFGLTVEADGSATINPSGNTVAPAGTFALKTKYTIGLVHSSGANTLYVNGAMTGLSTGDGNPTAQDLQWPMNSSVTVFVSNFRLYTAALSTERMAAHWTSTGNPGPTPL